MRKQGFTYRPKRKPFDIIGFANKKPVKDDDESITTSIPTDKKKNPFYRPFPSNTIVELQSGTKYRVDNNGCWHKLIS